MDRVWSEIERRRRLSGADSDEELSSLETFFFLFVGYLLYKGRRSPAEFGAYFLSLRHLHRRCHFVHPTNVLAEFYLFGPAFMAGPMCSPVS